MAFNTKSWSSMTTGWFGVPLLQKGHLHLRWCISQGGWDHQPVSESYWKSVIVCSHRCFFHNLDTKFPFFATGNHGLEKDLKPRTPSSCSHGCQTVLMDVMVRMSQQKYPRYSLGYLVGFDWEKKKRWTIYPHLSNVAMLGYTGSSFQDVPWSG